MADVYTRIGYIKGEPGAKGDTGAKGDQGDAATIQVGTVTTVPYGQTAGVVNSGTEQAAVFDFTIPQGRPGQETTDMQNLTLGSITTPSASFPIPAVGETGKVLWGKVVKWFSDMSALVATKLNIANVVNNLTTTAAGYALDARQGKALNDFATNVQNISVTFNGDTSKITTFAPTSCHKCGKIVEFQSGVSIIAPDGASPGLQCFTGLPKPASSTSIIFTLIQWYTQGPSMARCSITGNGNLFVRNGTAGGNYDIRITYISE